jgi:ubiquinone/menaquinone biosynthesis C-methylase UbiE
MSVNYDLIAEYYDDIYVNPKSYLRETKTIDKIIKKYKKCNGTSLLDIACGTGAQAFYLSKKYVVYGIDLNEMMLKIAQNKVPQAHFFKENMFDFQMNQQFDVILNLYGSIGFAKDLEELNKGMICAYNHLKSKGVFVLTPWGTKETFKEILISKNYNFKDRCLCRMESVKRISENKVQVEMFHLIGKGLEISSHHHIQTITLFSEQEYLNSLKNAGFIMLNRLNSNKIRMGAFICSKQ